MNAEITQLKSDFSQAENDSLFAISHNGVYSNVYYEKRRIATATEK